MAKEVARRYLERRAKAEYRLRIYACGPYIRNLAGLMRAFRDSKTKIAGVDAIPDLGVRDNFDSVSVWTSNYESLVSLKDWAEGRGMETSGIW